jgi:serine/threonine protein kinase
MTTHKPSGALPLGPGEQVGIYEIKRLLGRGSMAAVYRAYSPDLNADVALKILRFATEDDAEREQINRRFFEELKKIATLYHPNIARVYDYGTNGELHYIVMELVEGTTLRDLLSARRGGLSRDRALEIFRQVADGIAFAHSKNIIHHEIRPGNILLADDTRPVIVDFGLMRILGDDNTTTAEFSPKAPLYMSPEQASGAAITTRSDVYSLGILLYELVSGDVPFKGGPTARILVQHLQQEPRPPGDLVVDLDTRIESAIMKALEKDPQARFSSPMSMLEAIEQQIDAQEYDTITLERDQLAQFRQNAQAARSARQPDSKPAPSPAAKREVNPTTLALIVIGVIMVIAVVVVVLSQVAG